MLSELSRWHLSFDTGTGNERREDYISRLLALDRQYLLKQLTVEEYRTQVTDILALLES